MTQLLRNKAQHNLGGCVATVGNFDGVHLGHQQLLNKLVEAAKQRQLPSLVILFEPQPQEFFQHGAAPARITNLREKLHCFTAIGIDYVCCLPFNKIFSELSPDAFIKTILIDALHIKHLIIGHDFRFGYQRQGDFDYLQLQSQHYNFSVESFAAWLLENERVSSTLLRQALSAGDFEQAEQYLGRAYTIEGKVAHGDKVGRQLGFPTANILLKRHAAVLRGVFAVRAHSINEQVYMGVANLGKRPTVGGLRELLEVHLFDFDDEIYGQVLKIEFLQKIRDEQKFASLDDLKAQIAKDAIATKIYFKSSN